MYQSNNNDSFNVINNFSPANERLEILAWLSQLSQLDQQKQHRNIQFTRVDNVGDWFLHTPEFKDWCEGSGEERSDGAALFCCGDMGVGKTYISSLVVDKLCRQSWGTIACSYYDFASRSDQLPANVLGSLLEQLVIGLDDIPEEFVNAFKERKRGLGGRPLQLDEIIALFPVVTSSRRTLICIDALDECVRGRLKLLTSLGSILRGSSGTRLFLTGRPHIQSEIEMRLGGAVTIVSIATNKGDVASYFYTKLKELEDVTPDATDSNLEADIVSRVTETMSKMFRLASHNIDGILRETTIYRRRRRLNGVMDGSVLKTVYGPTLDRIEYEGPERRDPAMAALMWVCYSERPLRIDELRHALAVEIGSTDFESSNVPSEGTLLSCCQGLVIVDRQSSTARLIHTTLRDYLCTYLGYFVNAHSTIAETCLTYLNSQQVKVLSATSSPDLQGTPFLSYASRYWGTHAKMELSENSKSLAMQLFNQYDGHISARLLLQHIRGSDCVELDSSSVFTGLHCASFFGIAEVVDALMGIKSCGVNQRDWMGITPLMWADMYGHQDVVRLLQGQEDVDPVYRIGATAEQRPRELEGMGTREW